MLEPYVLKGTRTVLRREGGSNPIPDLSDYTTPVQGRLTLQATGTHYD